MSKSVIFLSVHIPMYDDCMTKLVKKTNSLFAKKNQSNKLPLLDRVKVATQPLAGYKKSLTFGFLKKATICSPFTH